ncbi:hypothetical protein T4B_13571 [Trichinella pseudospiralis]|uniref:Uncharacterized protein n=1 Tax=Trichinella pseudospiralis TaxID=6337 RepID=A0A0V1DWI0_TRIPS|nr:hypothetical protein T4A_12087 [Trichinella pseudospiralis]KRZ20375.1 hypothetical protein T4B_13571 [Trichinella pseudospiralis]
MKFLVIVDKSQLRMLQVDRQLNKSDLFLKISTDEHFFWFAKTLNGFERNGVHQGKMTVIFSIGVLRRLDRRTLLFLTLSYYALFRGYFLYVG